MEEEEVCVVVLMGAHKTVVPNIWSIPIVSFIKVTTLITFTLGRCCTEAGSCRVAGGERAGGVVGWGLVLFLCIVIQALELAR